MNNLQPITSQKGTKWLFPPYEVLENRCLLAGSNFLPLASIPEASALVSRWPLTETAGTRADVVGKNSLISNSSLGTSAGFANAASGVDYVTSASFQRGLKTYLSVTDTCQVGLDVTGALTVGLWFKPKELTPDVGHILVSKYWPTNDNLSYVFGLLGSHQIQLSVSSTGKFAALAQVVSKSSLLSDNWYHLVGVFDPGQAMRLYINGIEDGSRTTAVPTQIANRNAMFLIGAKEDGSVGFANGLINDVMVWNHALTGEKVSTLYTKYTTQPVLEMPAESNVLLVLPTTDEEVQVSTPPVPPVSPRNGQLERQSLAARLAREVKATDSILRTGRTYFDNGYKVDVYAPDSWFFVEYASEAIDIRQIPANLPAGQVHPRVNEVSLIVRVAIDVGKVPKGVKDTVLTLYDPVRGIDVYTGAGKYFILYIDGKVEERVCPQGGYVPRPPDFALGGADNSQPLSAFGPSAQELGLVTTANTPKPSGELVYIGASYVSQSGQLRVAQPGNVFLQDPVTRIMLERPIFEGAKAQVKPQPTTAVVIKSHSAAYITNLFTQAYGRIPSASETEYWQIRTDKTGTALLGAMQYAKSHETSTPLAGQTVVPPQEVLTSRTPELPAGIVDNLFAKFDGQTITQFNPKPWTIDWVEAGIDRQTFKITDWFNLQQDAAGYWWATRIEYVPFAPTSNQGLEFYRNDPDYLVKEDGLSPEDVNRIHPGGVKSIRVRHVDSLAGAQVILDASGNVIPPGDPGTGTPDIISPTGATRIMLHGIVEYLPWLLGI